MDRNEERTLYALYIGTLLRKHADNLPLEDQERKDLEDWYNGSEERRQIFLGAADKQAAEAEIRHLNAKYEANEAVGRIFAALGLDHGNIQKPGALHPVRRRLMGWLAAAAVIGALICGVWMMGNLRRNGVNPTPSSSSVTKRDIPPGRNTAILTLSEGRQILLDSAREGLLARQGSTRIDHTNGQIAYQNSSNTAEVGYNILSTPKGGQYHLLLPDGSKVWLNAASSIRFPTTFTGSVRSVEVQGEAYFEVSHNSKRPFIVVVNKTQTIKVLGTVFNVNAYEDEPGIRTTLLQGSVQISAGKEGSLLEPGQQISLQNGELYRVKNPNLEAAVAWKNGLFIFDHSDIQTVMRQLARWYNMDVEYRGQPTTDLFGGDIQRNLPLSKVFRILEKSQVHFSIEQGKIIVMP